MAPDGVVDSAPDVLAMRRWQDFAGRPGRATQRTGTNGFARRTTGRTATVDTQLVAGIAGGIARNDAVAAHARLTRRTTVTLTGCFATLTTVVVAAVVVIIPVAHLVDPGATALGVVTIALFGATHIV